MKNTYDFNMANIGHRFQLGSTDGSDSESDWFEIKSCHVTKTGIPCAVFSTPCPFPRFSGIVYNVAILCGAVDSGMLLHQYYNRESRIYNFTYELKF